MKLQVKFLHQLIILFALVIFGLILFEVSALLLKDFSFNLTLLFLFSGTILLVYSVSKLAIKIKISDTLYISLILIIAFLLRLFWVITVDTKPFSDFGLFLNTAKQFSSGSISAFKMPYYYRFPYNIPFTVYLSSIYNIFHSVFVLKFINVLLSTGIIYFLYGILRQAKQPKPARIVALLATVFPPFIIYTSVLTNQTISIFFYLWAIYLFIKSKSLFIVGFTLGVAQLFRPTAIVYFIALILLVLLTHFNKEHKTFVQKLKEVSLSLFKLIFSYYFILFLVSKIIIYVGINDKGLFYNPIPSYKFLVGFNHQTKGKYSVKDAALLNDIDNFEKIAKEKIKERTADKSKLAGLFIKKITIFWGESDASFFWALTDNIDNRNKYYSFKTPSRLLYITLWFFAYIALIFNLKNRNNDRIISLSIIVMTAFWFVYMFIEIQTRYRYEIYPMLLILSSMGIAYLLNKKQNLSLFEKLYKYCCKMNINKKKLFNRLTQFFIIITSVLLVLSFINFLYNRSLWLDEAFLGLNFRERSFFGLLRPLNHGQVAPIGYLLLLKILSFILGYHDWVFRLYSYATFLGTAYLLYQVVIKLFKQKLFAWFVLALYLSFRPVFYFSTELKQYMGDVFWGLLLWYLYFKYLDSPSSSKNFKLLLIAGVLSNWFSTVSVIILSAIFLHYVFLVIGIKKFHLKNLTKYKFLYILMAWLFSFLINAVIFLLPNSHKNDMLHFWRNHFMPANIFDAKAFDFLYSEFKLFYGIFSRLPHWHFYIIFMIIGLFYMIFRKKYNILIVSGAPITIHLIISALHKYPFTQRLILYLIPYFTIFIAYGIYVVYQKLSNKNLVIPAIILLLLPFYESFIVLKKEFPLKHEEIKIALKKINENIQPNQQVYVYFRSKYPFDFYKYEKIVPNIKSSQIVYGKRCNNTNNKNYKEDISKLKGDVWLLFSHIERYQGKRDIDIFYNNLIVNYHYKEVERTLFMGGNLIHVVK